MLSLYAQWEGFTSSLQFFLFFQTMGTIIVKCVAKDKMSSILFFPIRIPSNDDIDALSSHIESFGDCRDCNALFDHVQDEVFSVHVSKILSV